MVNGYGTIYWSIDNLPVATPIKNNDSSSLRSHQLPTGPQLWVGPHEPLPIYAGLLIGLTFCESFASTHDVQPSCHVGKTAFPNTPPYPLTLTFFPALSSLCSLGFGVWLSTNMPLRYEHSQSLSLKTLTNSESLHSPCPL